MRKFLILFTTILFMFVGCANNINNDSEVSEPTSEFARLEDQTLVFDFSNFKYYADRDWWIYLNIDSPLWENLDYFNDYSEKGWTKDLYTTTYRKTIKMESNSKYNDYYNIELRVYFYENDDFGSASVHFKNSLESEIFPDISDFKDTGTIWKVDLSELNLGLTEINYAYNIITSNLLLTIN